METNHLNDTQVSMATDSCGENAVDNRSQSRFCNRQYLPISPKFHFKRPRLLSISKKSELCILFQRGACYFGESCRYAHNMREIGNLGFKCAAEEEQLNVDRQRNDVCRGRECRFSYSGLDCPYGEKCHFLHKRDENDRGDLGLNQDSHAINIVNGKRGRSESDEIESKSLMACQYYKSKLCIKYERFGSCPYGVQCTYAHGKAELRGRSYYSKLEGDRAFRPMLDDVKPNKEASSQIGINAANKQRKEGKKGFVKWKLWNIENISETYADWVETIH